MNTRSICAFGAGLVAASTLAVLIAAAPMHETQAQPADAQPEMSPEEMMAAYMAMGQPGEHHEWLKKTAGTWHAKTSFVMDPANPDQREEGTGTCTNEIVMGGRFAKTKFEAEFMGMPFTGYAYTGYDNGRKHFVSIWIDTMSTSIIKMTGNMNKDGDLVLQGSAYAPGTGEYQSKMVYKIKDENNWSQTFYDQLPDGSWMKSGTISYTRK